MPARVLNGNVIRDQIYAELAGEISALAAAGIRPGLAAVLVGDGLGPGFEHQPVELRGARLALVPAESDQGQDGVDGQH